RPLRRRRRYRYQVMRIFENANYQFIPNRKKAYIFSGTIILISVLSLVTRGVEMGIDFLGGMEFVVETAEPLDVADVRAALTGPLGGEPEGKTLGAGQLLIRAAAAGDINEMQGRVVQGLTARFPEAQPQVLKTDIVGPRFAEDLK